MNDFINNVIGSILEGFSPATLVAVILVNFVIEIVQRIRKKERHGSLVRETGAFIAVMAVMTAWAFLSLAIPVGIARIQELNLASPWLLAAGLLLYLAGGLPLGYLMLGLLLGAQETSILDRRELARQRTPAYVYASLFKIGVLAIALALLAFPALSDLLPGISAGRAVLLRYAIVALLLADTVCYGWVLVVD